AAGSCFFFQAEDGIRDFHVTGVQTCALPILAEKFGQETLLDMAQMTIPTRAEVDKSLKELEQAAKDEMEQLAEQAREAAEQARASGQEIDPQQAEQQFQQAQQAILEKYQPRSEEHTSELQSRENLVCRLLLEKKKS